MTKKQKFLFDLAKPYSNKLELEEQKWVSIFGNLMRTYNYQHIEQ